MRTVKVPADPMTAGGEIVYGTPLYRLNHHAETAEESLCYVLSGDVSDVCKFSDSTHKLVIELTEQSKGRATEIIAVTPENLHQLVALALKSKKGAA